MNGPISHIFPCFTYQARERERERVRGLLHNDEVLTIKWRNKSSLAQNKLIKGTKRKK